MRALISLITRSAIIFSRSFSSSAARNLADSPIDRSHTSAMLCSPMVTASEAGRLQPGAAARRARHLAHVALDLLPAPVRLGVGVAALQERDDALVRRGVLALAAVAVLVLHRDLALGAEQQHVLLRLGELRPRLVEVDLVAPRPPRRACRREVLRAGRAPRRDGALADREVGVRHHQLGVDLERGAEAVARLAGAVRRVEREVAGRQLLVRLEADRAGQVLAEGERLGLGVPSPSRGTSSISTTPSASRSAVSTESVSRRSMPSRFTRRSTTISMVCCS